MRSRGDIPRLEDLLDLVDDYRDSVQFAESAGAKEISDAVGALIFGEPEVLELFQATRGAAADRGRQMLVRVLASPHLATLPWELLPDPAAGLGSNRSGYLALASDAHVIRMARGRSYATRIEPLQPPLNLLIVLSSPSPRQRRDELLAFDLYEVKRSLLDELSPLIEAGLLKVCIEDRPTLENLRRRIGSVSRGFQLFHYVGHALPEKLVLEDLAGRREDRDSSTVCEILRMCPELRLAVFAGCETARAQIEASDRDARLAVGWRNLVSLADRCVQEACPMVIGMQAVLPFRTERLFTRFFYQGIASGYSVAESLRLARGAARSDTRVGVELLDWSVPALFIGSGEPGPVIDRNAKGMPPAPFSRHDLKIGLRQPETRFFARDLPLRQAVDVLARRTRERVLVVTGVANVGKTYLVDRALEELGSDATHVLYVKLGRLAPELDAVREAVGGRKVGWETVFTKVEPDWSKILSEFDPHAPHRELCKLISDLLRQGTSQARPDTAIALADWWDQIIEDINRVRLAVVIDEFELFDELMDACFTRWLWPIVDHVISPGTQGTPETTLEQLDEMLEIVRTGGAPGWAASGVPSAAAAAMQQVWERLTDNKWQLSHWHRVSVCRSLEPILFSRMTETRLPGLGSQRLPDATEIRTLAESIDKTRSILEQALYDMAKRRSGCRTIIVTTRSRADLLSLRAEERFDMRLAHITWQETWRWIRRNLPGLTRYDESDLQRAWTQFGPELERWEDLEREILSGRGTNITLDSLVQQIRPTPERVGSAGSGFGIAAPRAARPLRLAIAGPHIVSAAALAQAITRLATLNGVGGRVTPDSRRAPATLGELIDVPSPFVNSDGSASGEQVEHWLEQVMEQRPDLVLLDYGRAYAAADYKLGGSKERELFARHRRTTLFIAAGDMGGPGELFEPAVFPEVLTVGAIDENGAIRPYSPWRPKFKKPDLFVPDGLENTPLQVAIRVAHNERIEGTSFAALHAMVTATLVWSLLPALGPVELRGMLHAASRPIEEEPERHGIVPHSLLVGDALHAARAQLVTGTLKSGPCSRDTLAALTGQNNLYLEGILNELVEAKIVHRVLSGRLERFEFCGA
jgi:hypothetical protein